ncbi:hypothetical protein, partial [Halorhodospira halochloris]|uniref:hypothetical protein n=1 Tax=Halorhodospira halochloris TaxID=1052 RepID=UPI001EE97162
TSDLLLESKSQSLPKAPRSGQETKRVAPGAPYAEFNEAAAELADALLLRSLERPAWLDNRETIGRRKGTLETLYDIVQEITHRSSLPFADAFANCISSYLSGREALPMLELLAELGHAPSKAQAMAIALRAADKGRPLPMRTEEQAELRRQAMAVALSQPQSNVLAK